MKKTIALGLLLLLSGINAWAYTEIEGFTGETWYDHRASDFGGGSGSEYDPYIIRTPEQLALLAWRVNEERNTYDEKFFRLDADISLKGYVWVPIGIHNAEYESPFQGTLTSGLEEGYHTISDMTIKATGVGKTAYFGLFGDLMGTVEGLKLAKAIIDINCDAAVYVGTYCGEIGTADGSDKRSVLYRCDVESADITVNANNRSFIGGVFGTTETYVGKIECCVAKTMMTLTGVGIAGGIGGACDTGMRECHAVVDIKATSSEICQVGGLVGNACIESSTKNFICCSTAGEINNTGNSGNVTGGIFGRADYNNDGFNKLQYSSTCVTVRGTGYLGGIIGYCFVRKSPGLFYCFCSSYIDGRQATNVGGIVGRIEGLNVSTSIKFGSSVTFAGTISKPTASGARCGSIVGYIYHLSNTTEFGYPFSATDYTNIGYDRLMCGNLPTNGNGRNSQDFGTIEPFTTPSFDAWDYSHYWMATVPIQAPGAIPSKPYYRDIYDLCSIPFHISPDRLNFFPAYDATVVFSLENLMNNYNHEKMANYSIEPSDLVKIGDDDLKVEPLDPGEVIVHINHKGLVRKVYLNIGYGLEWDGTSSSTSFFGTGNGSISKPYWIHSVAELKGAMDDPQYNRPGVYFKLANDLFINNHLLQDDETPREGAHKWTPREWKAELDGNGKIIYGLYVDAEEPDEYSSYGLFTHLYGTITNLGIVDSYIHVSDIVKWGYTGMFCGEAFNTSRIERCMAHGVIVVDGLTPAAGICGMGGDYENASSSSVTFADCLSAVHVRTRVRQSGAGIVVVSALDDYPIRMLRCLNIGKVDTGSGLILDDTKKNLSEDSYFDLQMMKLVPSDMKGAKTTSELTSGEIFKNASAWVQQEGRYPMLKQFAHCSYADLLSMPVNFYADDTKTDRAGSVTEIFEFCIDDAEWHAAGGNEYMDVIQECGAASLNKRTPTSAPDYLVGQSLLNESRCRQAQRSVALDINVDGVVGIRFKDPAVEQACIQAFDKDGNQIITLRESCEATNAAFQNAFNPAAAAAQYFPEMRFFVGVRNLESGMLSGLSQLSELELPKQLRTIDAESFSGCSSLENITLPPPFEETLPGAFYGSSIRDIFVANKNKTLESRQGVLYTNGNEFLYYPYALMAYPPARGQDTIVVNSPLKTILSGAVYKIPGLKAVYIDNPLPEGGFVELLEDGIVHENAPELMQVYINDGSSWGAELEDQDEPVLFADYQNSYDWYDYVEQGKITRYYPLNVTSAGWATLYIGFATDLPSDLSPYIVLDKNFDQKVATLKRISQLVPHETPLVIKARQPGQYILYPHTEPVPEINKFENRLIGSFIGQDEKFGTPINQIDLSNGSILTLGRNSNGTVGFFYYNSVAPIPPYRAYLTYNSVTPESDSKSYFTFYIDDTIDTEPDAIDAPVSGQPLPTAVYNLQGQKLGTINQNQDTRRSAQDTRRSAQRDAFRAERGKNLNQDTRNSAQDTRNLNQDTRDLKPETRNLKLDRLPKGIYIVGGKKIIVP